MRAVIARALRAIADRLSGQPEADAHRLDVRRLEQDVAHWKRHAEGEAASCEWYITERDRLERQLCATRGEATFWLRAAGDQSEALIRQGAARDRQVPPPPDRVVVPFGRRQRPPA